MATKKAAKKAPAKKAGEGGPKSFIRMLDANLKREERIRLFGAVAERVNTGLLTTDEAALIAGWFTQLAEGADPKKVFFKETRGRPKGANSLHYIKGQDVALPDHVDLVWSLRRWIARNGDPDEIFKLCAKHFQRTEQYIRDLYDEILPTLGADPDL
jgi:hypothetical protein